MDKNPRREELYMKDVPFISFILLQRFYNGKNENHASSYHKLLLDKYKVQSWDVYCLKFHCPHGLHDGLWVPVWRVPAQEPACEGGRLVTLFHDHHRSQLVPPSWVTLDVLLSCKGNKIFTVTKHTFPVGSEMLTIWKVRTCTTRSKTEPWQ